MNSHVTLSKSLLYHSWDMLISPNYNISTWKAETIRCIPVVDIANYLPSSHSSLLKECFLDSFALSVIIWPMICKRRLCDWVLAKAIWMQVYHVSTPHHKTPHPQESLCPLKAIWNFFDCFWTSYKINSYLKYFFYYLQLKKIR